MSPLKAYTVEKKVEVRRLNKNNEVETVFQIYATTAGGTYFHIDVPESNLKDSDKLLTERAVQLDNIK